MADLFMAPLGSDPDDSGAWTHIGETDGTPVMKWVTETAEIELTVTCERHGPMRHRLLTREWVCAGFDGEGCATVIPDEKVAGMRAAARRLPG